MIHLLCVIFGYQVLYNHVVWRHSYLDDLAILSTHDVIYKICSEVFFGVVGLLQ